MRLRGKTAIVTGSGRGIGAAMARGFAQQGANVVLVSRTLAQLKEQEDWIQANTGVSVLSVEADVGDAGAVQRMVEQALDGFGHIDILANCAGITMVSPSETLSLENWHKCLRINLDGTFLCCQKVGAHMIERGMGGKIINITSIVAHAAIPERAAYAASKGGVMQLTQNLAVEWAKHNIQVNAISPGFIRTEIVQDLIDKGVHKPERMTARIPAGRMGEVEDLVGPAVFYASSDSDYVTGTILKVDGGWLANGYV
ncbi:SDR family NAD(P)-dependent oxidoreductase [Paenibacillus turpanensis]|uniref:SDR family NAD(P)-dependent oxidoreductase n=1 Tax=Paenibacillus turpanensis TaxID=2689078 RepID=UPI00140C893D|nr:glucose 1-dehydrogenase [Paenibacillus turpanensis]